MARWRLTAKHYINVLEKDTGEKVEWIREETNPDTGRKLRRPFQVPMLLDPDDVTCKNRDGDVIVSRADSVKRGDFVYEGPPTVDMEPLDDEAEEISKLESVNWTNPIDAIPGNGDYGANLLDHLSKQLNEAILKNPVPQATSLSGVSASEFGAMKEQMAVLMKQNAELMAEREPKTEPKVVGDRR